MRTQLSKMGPWSLMYKAHEIFSKNTLDNPLDGTPVLYYYHYPGARKCIPWTDNYVVICLVSCIMQTHLASLSPKHVPLSPVRWHSTNIYLSSPGILGTEPDYFPTQQPLL